MREPDTTIDLIELGSALLDRESETVADAVRRVQGSGFTLVASPTYKSSYTGVLKIFLDRFATGSLSGTTAVPLMLGGSRQHALAPEVFLKPVLSELGASMPTSALYLPDSDAANDWAENAELTSWLVQARRQLPAELIAGTP